MRMKTSYYKSKCLLILFMLICAIQSVGCDRSNRQTVSFNGVDSFTLYATGNRSNSQLVAVSLDELSVQKSILDKSQLKLMFTGMNYFKRHGIAKYDPGLAVITLGNGEAIRVRTNSLEDTLYVLAPEKFRGYYKLPDVARGKLFAFQDRKII